jgi:MerR family transcriptional regulator, thiopeptide resistance regulator
MSMHTVKQLARLSGVSVRTLHYYDQIGLLRPAQVGANGYRYYGRTELLRLQQILLHRELGLPLDAIATLLDDSDRSRIERLREHRRQLAQRAEQFQALIATVDRTIIELEGGLMVDTKHLYSGFSAEKQAGYEAELIERYGEPVRGEIEASRRHVGKFGPEAVAVRMRELAEVEAELAQHCRRQTPAGDSALNGLLERHRAWVSCMWGKPCPASRYAGLADLYESHADFRARYEQLAPGLADYLPAVMRAYAGTAAG